MSVSRQDVEEEKRLIAMAQRGDLEARKQVHIKYKKLLDVIVSKYRQGNVPESAMRLEADRLLDTYMNSYNEAYGQPNTYFTDSITKKLIRYRNDNSMVRMPETVSQHAGKFTRIYNSLYDELGREPDDMELAKRMTKEHGKSFTPKEIQRFRTGIRSFKFQSSMLGGEDDGGIALGDVAYTNDEDSMDSLLDDLRVGTAMTKIYSLPEPNKSIIMHYLGLNGYPRLSERNLAIKYGMSRNKVRNVIAETEELLQKS